MAKQYFGDEDAEFDKDPRKKGTYSDEMADLIIEDILSGLSLYTLAKREDRPSYATIWNWRRKNEDFHYRVRDAEHRRGPLKATGRPPHEVHDHEEVLNDICQLIEQGCPIDDACWQVGMHRSTLYWLRNRWPEVDDMIRTAVANSKERRK